MAACQEQITTCSATVVDWNARCDKMSEIGKKFKIQNDFRIMLKFKFIKIGQIYSISLRRTSQNQAEMEVGVAHDFGQF